VSGILGSPEATRVLLFRRLPPFDGEITVECFVGTLVVVAVLKLVESLLLLSQVLSGRPGRLSLEVLVHALMLTILLRACWPDALMNDAEFHPPDVELA
jgi:hypothetical protein